ncbi:MAG: TolC family protein [Pedobacter sp.]|nr:MAG: TolC family protein [Pedobacter sp.]
MKIVRLLYILCVFISQGVNAAPNDTLQLKLPDAERLFLTNNYELLIANYQIDQAQAEIITAKLFDNPELTYENLFYNHETRRFFETSFATGQYNAQIAQLVKLAGKRKKSIQLAESGVKMAENEYSETLRSLRFQLRDTYYRAYYGQQSAQVYSQEILGSEKLLITYKQQLGLGNVAQKDVIRIQSLILSLKSELNELLESLEEDLTNIKLLCRINANTPLKLELDETPSSMLSQVVYVNLLDSARNNRSDYKLAKSTVQYNEANLKLQKAMAIPDVELSLSYDLKGNYPEKYTGIGIRVPLPLFNRNQGEIKKAKIGLEASTTDIKRYEAILENEVYQSYQKALRTEQHYETIDPKFNGNFNELMIGINKNFKERILSLIEFLDFYNAYKETTLQINQLKYQRLSNLEEINYVTGSNIFN